MKLVGYLNILEECLEAGVEVIPKIPLCDEFQFKA